MNQTEWEASIERVGVVAACLVIRDGTYLFVQEKQLKAYGLWNLPAGHVDKGEDLEHAAIREAKEETGYDVTLIKQIAIFHETAPQTVKHVFLAEITGGDVQPQEDEILQVKWLSFNEIKALHDDGKLRSEWVWSVIERNHDESAVR